MTDDLRKELGELAEKINRRQSIDSMIGSLREEEKVCREKQEEINQLLEKENMDVEKLEKTTLLSIFYDILGKKEEKLDKEQKEAYAARLKADAAVNQLNDCLSRIEALVREKSSLAGIDRRYKEVYEAIQEDLRHDPVYADKLCEAEKKLSELRNQAKEIAEAESAGKACLQMIGNIEKSLSSAEGWGTFDILGGGLISDMAKHSHLDEAQEEANRLQTSLSRFRTELADVKISEQMGQVNIDGFLRFADFFFDGLIADWSVLSKIHDSQNSVSNVKNQVTAALRRLDSVKETCDSRRRELEQQIENLVRYDYL